MFSQENSSSEPQVVISGFTPINRPNVAQLPPIPENSGESAILQGNGTSSKDPIRSKKRTASRLATSSAAGKKPKKSSRSQTAPKCQSTGEVGNQDISGTFGHTKYLNEPPQSRATGNKGVDQGKKDDAILSPQVANVGDGVFARTMRKLDAFRFGAASGSEAHVSYHDETRDEKGNVEGLVTHIDRSEPNETHLAFTSQQGSITRVDQDSEGHGRAQYRASQDKETLKELNDHVINHSTEPENFSGNPSQFFVLGMSVKIDLKEMSLLGGTLENSQDRDLSALYSHRDDITSLTSAPVHSEVLFTEHSSMMSAPESLTAEEASITPIDDHTSESSQDEFPIDGDEVEHMLGLSAAHESFRPSSSLQFPFDDDSQMNEECDILLQYSRSSSKRSVHTVSRDGQMFPVEGQTTLDALSSTSFRPLSSYSVKSSTNIVQKANTPIIDLTQDSDDNFLSDEDEQDLLALTSRSPANVFDEPSVGTLATSSSPKLQWNPPIYYKPPQSSWIAGSVKSSSDVEASPAVLTSESPLAPHQIAFDIEGNPIPFARPKFPEGVLDRSPIPGFSRSSVLRTCFRIGEALNAASCASRSNVDTIIELYSRVTYSERDANGLKQYFQFADLFRSERPPFLNGSYDMWKGVELWDSSAKEFLGEAGKNKIARVLGRIKRDEKHKDWMMLIMSIWAASWEDVGLMKGLVCA